MQDFEGLIDTAAAAGLGVINIQPLSAGALTGDYHANARDFVRERGPLFRAKGDQLADVARDFDLDNTYELAFRFALRNRGNPRVCWSAFRAWRSSRRRLAGRSVDRCPRPPSNACSTWPSTEPPSGLQGTV